MAIRYVAVALCCLSLACRAGAACDDPPRLRFSVIPEADARKAANNFAPLLKGLEQELGRPVEIVIPSSYGTVIEGLVAGSIDLAMMGPASYAAAKNKDSGIQAFASIVKKGGTFQEEGQTYRSLLIVRGDSPYRSIDSLKGRRVLLVDPASTSGSVIPRHLVAPLVGGPLEKFFNRVSYSGGHDKSARLLLDGQVDAAFVASSLLTEFLAERKVDAKEIRVLWQSDPLPLDPFVYRERLCEPIRRKIQKAFLDNAGQSYPKVLEAMKALRFVQVDDADYENIRALLLAP